MFAILLSLLLFWSRQEVLSSGCEIDRMFTILHYLPFLWSRRHVHSLAFFASFWIIQHVHNLAFFTLVMEQRRCSHFCNFCPCYEVHRIFTILHSSPHSRMYSMFALHSLLLWSRYVHNLAFFCLLWYNMFTIFIFSITVEKIGCSQSCILHLVVEYTAHS